MNGREFKDAMYDGLGLLADEAVKILSENGYKVRRLDEGYPEWKMRQQFKIYIQ